MGGGAGDDLFLVTDASDLLIETAAAGADTIITSVSMTMADHVETLRIASDISGITLTGSAGNDMLVGNGLSSTRCWKGKTPERVAGKCSGRKSGEREAPKCFTFCIDYKLKDN
jgi:hypothetical protein